MNACYAAVVIKQRSAQRTGTYVHPIPGKMGTGERGKGDLQETIRTRHNTQMIQAL